MTLQIKDQNGKVVLEKEIAIYNNIVELTTEDLRKAEAK